MTLRTTILTVLLVVVAVAATAFSTPTTRTTNSGSLITPAVLQIAPLPVFAWPQISWLEIGQTSNLPMGGFYDIPLVRGAFHGTDVDANNDNLFDDRLDLWITVYHAGSEIVLNPTGSDDMDVNNRVQLIIWDSVNMIEYPVMPGAVGTWDKAGFEVDAAGGIRIPSATDQYGLRLRHKGAGSGGVFTYIVAGVGRRDSV